MNNKIFRFQPTKNAVGGIDWHRNVLNERFLLHTHDYYEFEYAASGTGINRINGVDHPVSAGSIWGLGPEDDHRPEGKELVIYHISFYLPRLPESLSRLIRPLSFPLLGHISDENDREKLMRCFDILMGGSPDNPYYREEKQSAAMLILLCFLTHLQPEESSHSKTADYVRRAIRYLHDHADEPIRLSDVAGTLYIAPCYLSAIFADHAGCTFGEYLTRIRLARAQNLLRTTDLSVTDIAGRVGFGCVASMNRAFRKYMGGTPSGDRRG